ncbi:hypothetical protein CEXT_213611 [Caerostris extrusa]|uniref:Uncharacterized protein n=1 Tax=Caerostris extrusa TaxID=172846 RepID=A0AAV4MD30_CAEEX|nr:hypothetical protein CEXT_213611 [Caerostris extrusa]
MPLGDCCQTSVLPVLDEMGREFFADKGLAGHRDKDLQNVSRGLPWFHCCWAFLAAKRRFLRLAVWKKIALLFHGHPKWPAVEHDAFHKASQQCLLAIVVTSPPPVLDEMGRRFFADKSLAGHRDKDLQNVSRGLPWFHCCWAFLAAKRRFLRWLHGRKEKMAANSFKQLDALLKSTIKM